MARLLSREQPVQPRVRPQISILEVRFRVVENQNGPERHHSPTPHVQGLAINRLTWVR